MYTIYKTDSYFDYYYSDAHSFPSHSRASRRDTAPPWYSAPSAASPSCGSPTYGPDVSASLSARSPPPGDDGGSWCRSAEAEEAAGDRLLSSRTSAPSRRADFDWFCRICSTRRCGSWSARVTSCCSLSSRASTCHSCRRVGHGDDVGTASLRSACLPDTSMRNVGYYNVIGLQKRIT